MANYTLIQSAEAIRNILDQRVEDLRKSKAGQYYEQALVQQRAELDALPDALTGRVPLAANLKIADADHDGYGAVIFFITQAALRSPDTPELMRAAAIRVAEAFVPALAQLQDPYVVEAHRAAERRPLLETMKADLEMFPVRQGVTLLQVATNFLDAGDTLNSLLDQRGDIPKADRSKAAAIRAKSVGLLNRLRADLRDEVANTPSVPRDLEQRVFGYLDTIAAMTKPARSGKEGPPAPATT